MPEQSGGGVSGRPDPRRHNGGGTHAETYQGHGSELANRMEEGLEELRERADQIGNRAAELVKRSPLVAVAGAAAIGFLVGRLVSRR